MAAECVTALRGQPAVSQNALQLTKREKEKKEEKVKEKKEEKTVWEKEEEQKKQKQPLGLC